MTPNLNMLVDSSERKRVEADLAEQQAQLGVFFEHAPAAIAMFDREMRYLAVSRRFVIDFRLPPHAQLIGKSHYEVFPEIPQRWRDIHARVLAGEELSNEEDQFTRQDGRTEWTGWSMAPWRGGDGRIGGAVLIAEVRTEQVEARRALADSEARFRATFENAAVGVVLVGPDGTLLRVNDSFARMLGCSTNELKSKNFQDITHPDDLEASLSVMKKVLVGETDSCCVEKRYIRKNGGIVWANLNVGCVRKADGAVDYFISVIEDITDRKLAELALAERNAQLALAGQAALVGSHADDVVLERMAISNGYAAIHGLPEGTTETTRGEWRARVHPEDLARVEENRTGNFHAKRDAYNLDYRIVRANGEVRWIEARGIVAYYADGQPRRVIGINIDVTERKQAEALLKESKTLLSDALAAGQVVAFEWDAATGRSQRSDNADGIMGLLGDGCFLSRVHPDDRDNFKTCMRYLSPGNPSYALTFRFVHPDGRQVWLEETAKGEFDPTGRLLRIKGLTRDITKRKQAELALAERNAQLALAGQAALVGSYAYESDLERMTVSEGYAAIHGLPDGTTETTRSEWRRRVHPDDLERMEGFREQAFGDKQHVYNVEYRIVRASGEVRWIESRSFITYDNEGRPRRVIGINIDITGRKRAEERQRVLVAELDHRVKNVLATVSAIVTQTQEASSSQIDFVDALNRRINSLARTHALLSESNWRGASLAEIVRREFAPYAPGNSTARGPGVILKAEATQAVATVLHELTTNAAKYGAFSNRTGRVSVQWQWLQNGSRELVLEWRETDGPPVVAPSRSGYGTSIIRELIPFELGGKVDLVFASEGIRCRLEIPTDWTSSGVESSGKSGALDEIA
jgi:PAS domain S-box-containing protein